MGIQQMLLGKRPAGGVFLQDVSRSANRVLPNAASANFSVNNTVGNISTAANAGAYVVEYAWLLAGVSADYDVRLTPSGGDLFGGDATSTWLNAGTPRYWNITRSTAGTNSGSCLIEMRPAGGGATLASATVTLTATATAAP